MIAEHNTVKLESEIFKALLETTKCLLQDLTELDGRELVPRIQ